MAQIAIVDDDNIVNDAWKVAIQHEFLDVVVDQYLDFNSAQAGLSSKSYDLVLLDIDLGKSAMEKIGGFPLALLLRDREVPVIIVSGASRESLYKPIMTSLSVWDYLEKPIEEVDLLNKVRQVLELADLRRQRRASTAESIGGNLTIDPLARKPIVWNGEGISASVTQVKILQLLVKSPNEVVSYDKLMELCPSSRAIDNLRTHIKELREGFRSVDPHFELIVNVPMKGYMWSAKQ